MTRLYTAHPFIIAEVGSNWHSLKDCIDSISIAHQVGADAVKFQIFNSEDLYGRDLGTIVGELPKDWLPDLAAHANNVGIEFMCTAFSERSVDIVDPYVKVHKVASSDATHFPLLRHIKKCQKPILVSVGAKNSAEILAIVNELAHTEFVLMYCNASYPSYEHNLFKMRALRDYRVPVGYSDHSLDVLYSPLSALRHFGALAIEKHFRLSRIMPGDTPDALHSLDEGSFAFMVDHLRGVHDYQDISREELPFLLRHNRRAIATMDIAKGEKLKYRRNYGFFRSTKDDVKGVSGLYYDDLEGKRALRDIPVADTIGPGDY